MNLSGMRRKFVVLKFTMLRGYAWCQLPATALVGAGVLFPYSQHYIPGIKLWQLAIFAVGGMMLAGWIDKKFRLLHEEQNYITETNPTLMAGLRGELDKTDTDIAIKDKPKDI